MDTASAQGVRRYSAEKLSVEDLKVLNSPINLNGVSASNVFLKAAMTERLSSWDQKDSSKRGIPSEELIRVYEQWGRGGFGVILSGNTMVNNIDLEAPGNPTFPRGGDEPQRLDAFKRVAAGAKANGSVYIVQLSHAGRQVVEQLNPTPVSASDVKLDDRMGFSFGKPTPLSIEGIKDVVDQFASAAVYAQKTGAGGVQLHAAHGYLLAQFLASSTNKRTDEYGGSISNRARIIFEIVDEIKKRIPEAGKSFVLAVKINSIEFQHGGFQPEECAQVCQKLCEAGVSLFELSGGTYEDSAHLLPKGSHSDTRKNPPRSAKLSSGDDFSDQIISRLPKAANVYVTGGFRTGLAMVNAIKSGSTQGIGLARPATAEFDLPKKLISGEVSAAIQPLFDDSDVGVTNIASGTQIRQVGRGLQPFDPSDISQVEKFQIAVQGFMEKFQQSASKGIIEPGFPILGSYDVTNSA